MVDQPLNAQFFVVRQNNRMIPLVALDELPDHIIIKGVPRTLELRDVQGMICIGTHGSRHQKHTVININQSPATPLGQQNLASLIQGVPESVSHPHISTFPRPDVSRHDSEPEKIDTCPQGLDQSIHADKLTTTALPAKPPVSFTKSPASTSGNTDSFILVSGPALASSTPPPGVKTYCSYWLRTGNCDFAQQGCMYKHKMPMDLDVLNRLGHRDIPSWYRQKFGVGSFLAVDGADASFNRPNLKSVIASGSHQESRVFNDWRTKNSTASPSQRPATAGKPNASGNPFARDPFVSRLAPIRTTQPRLHRRISAVSVASDFEAEVLREDQARKAAEEAEYQRSKADNASHQDTTASASEAVRRPRGCRGGSKKKSGSKEGTHGQK